MDHFEYLAQRFSDNECGGCEGIFQRNEKTIYHIDGKEYCEACYEDLFTEVI